MKKYKLFLIGLLLLAIPSTTYASFCGYLKAGTVATLKLGPFLDNTDGDTVEDGLTLTQADIRLSKNGGNFAQKTEATNATIDELGYYDCPIDATDTNTEGRLKVIVHEAGALMVVQTYMVVNANVFDSLYAAATTDYLQVDLLQIGGATQSGTDLKDFADAGYDPATDKVTGVKLTDNTSSVAALANNVITAASINADAITEAKIADNAIAAEHLNATAVTKIIDDFETQSQADPTGFHVNVKEVNGTEQTANDNGADINDILTDTSSTLDTLIKDIPTTAELALRTLLAADYTVVGDLGTVQSGDSFAIVNGDHGLVSIQDDIDDIPNTAEFALRTMLTADYTIVADLGTVQTGDSFTRIGALGVGLTAITDDTGQIGALGVGLTEAGGTGDQLTAIDLPNQTMDITGSLSGSVGSVSGAVGSVAADVGITQAGADKAWSTAARTLTALDEDTTTIDLDGTTVGTVTTATTCTNLTNAPTAGDFTATMKTSLDTAADTVTVTSMGADVLTASALNADAVTEIIDNFETQSAADPTGFKVNVMEVNGTSQTAGDLADLIGTAQADLNTITGSDGVTLATAQGLYAPNIVVPDAAGVAPTAGEIKTAIEAAGSHLTLIKAVTDIIPDAGALTTIDTNTARLTAERAAVLTDWINGGRLDVILDAILVDTSAMGSGAGSITYVYNVTDLDTGGPLDGASVWVTTDSAGLYVIASGVTDDAGNVTFYLDAGTRYFWRSKAGHNFNNPDEEIIS